MQSGSPSRALYVTTQRRNPAYDRPGCSREFQPWRGEITVIVISDHRAFICYFKRDSTARMGRLVMDTQGRAEFSCCNTVWCYGGRRTKFAGLCSRSLRRTIAGQCRCIASRCVALRLSWRLFSPRV